MDQNDLICLALVAWREARGEGVTGCQAVMHVVLNRVGYSGFPRTLHDVIYEKNAFSSMSIPWDLNFFLEPKANDPVYASCKALAASIVGSEDVTKNAHYYANLKKTTSTWFLQTVVGRPDLHPVTATIGNHTFYL